MSRNHHDYDQDGSYRDADRDVKAVSAQSPSRPSEGLDLVLGLEYSAGAEELLLADWHVPENLGRLMR